MTQSFDQTQTVQTLYELSMAIGTSLDLRQMLKTSLLAFLKKLNCVAGGVYQGQLQADGAYEFKSIYTVPRHTQRNGTYQAALAQIPSDLAGDKVAEFLDTLPLIGQHEAEHYYHLLELPNFGLMILAKNNQAIEPTMLKSLAPLQERLAAAANACLAEAALREAQERAQTILESVTVPLLISGLDDGKIIYANQLLSDMIRLPLDDLIGNVTPDFYYDPADRQTLLGLLQKQGALKEYEIRLKRGDGEPFWAWISIKIFNYQGEMALITSLIDVTDRKQTEAQKAKLANELATVAQVSTAASTLLEPDLLLQEVVDLTKEGFGLYHAHVLLLNEQTNDLVLAAGAGEIGQQMLAEGRHIPLAAQESLVATVARNKKGAFRNYANPDEGFMPHPLLAKTRSELAVPILLGDEVLGILDVRSEQYDYFSEADMQTLTALAAQVAVALQNARSFARSEQAVKELQELSRRLTREGWDDYLTQRSDALTFSYAHEQQTAVPASQAKLFTQPLHIQGEAIGQLKLKAPEQVDEEMSELVTAVVERLSTHLENLRLTEQSELARSETEKRSREMAIINDIVTQISASMDLQHSLQIIVDELATALNFDQVRVALIQPNNNEMLIIAEHFDPKSPSAVGMTIPLEGNELSQEVIETRQMVVVEDAQNNPRTAPVHGMFREQGIETVVLLPLVVNDEVLGTIGLDILDERAFDHDTLRLAETIVYQAAVAVQNARLFEQTQSALAETEALYAYTSQLNTASNLDAVLDSVAAPGFQVGASDALLLVYDQEATGKAGTGRYIASSPKNVVPLGEPISLREQPFSKLWPSGGKNILFVGDVSEEQRLDEKDRTAFLAENVHALAIMLLTVGNLRLGQIFIRWQNKQTFTEVDERLYGAIAQQASAVVYNRLLFNQTEEALSETAALYQASVDLNAADTYEQILNVLRQHTILGQGSSDVALNLFNRVWESDGMPETVSVMARWSTLPTELPTHYPLSAFPEAKTVLKPDKWLVCADVESDERMGEKTRAIFMNHFQAKSLLYVPLVVGGQWIGFLSGIYSVPRAFPESQIRRLNVLAGQAAVSIQSLQLLSQTRRRADREALINSINQKIQAAPTVQSALQTAVSELGQALKLKKAMVGLAAEGKGNGRNQPSQVGLVGEATDE